MVAKLPDVRLNRVKLGLERIFGQQHVKHLHLEG